MNLAREQAEMLRAAIALAVADGVIAPSERGLLRSLARRIGVAADTLDKMIARASSDPSTRERLFQVASADPHLTLELLVAAARIDGEIHDEEQAALTQLAERLDVPVSEFDEIYARGIARADKLRGNKRA